MAGITGGICTVCDTVVMSMPGITDSLTASYFSRGRLIDLGQVLHGDACPQL